MVQEQKKKLGVLGSSLEKLGTVSEMKSLLSELMQYDIHPEELDEIGNLAKDKPLLYHKLKDVQTIYQGFSEFLRKRYITAEEVLDLLCEKIGSSRLVRDSWIVLDGFTGFTPIQNKLLRELLKMARQIWVTVTLDEKVSVAQLKRPQHLFRMSGKMMESLTRMAAEERVEVLDPGGCIRENTAVSMRHRHSNFWSSICFGMINGSTGRNRKRYRSFRQAIRKKRWRRSPERSVCWCGQKATDMEILR